MDRTRVREEVRSFLSARALVDIVSNGMDLFETGALDSMTIVELLLFLEENFGLIIKMAELDLADLSTIDAITELVVAQGSP